jgi:beta-lactamase superfamily II metal-dependent hydrolase
MSESNLSIVDVGHGNSTILYADGETIIVDCGARGSALLEFLADRKIAKIKAIYLSHADQDHIGGLITILANGAFEVGEIFLNSDASKDTKLWGDLTFLLDASDRSGGIKFEPTIHSELGIAICGEIELAPIGPSKLLVARGVGNKDRNGKKITSNGISASFLVSHRGMPVAFLSGDIDQIGLDEIEFTGKDIRAMVLVFPHHGGKPDDSDEKVFTNRLMDLVSPKTVVFSIGRNKWENPRPEIVDVIKARGVGTRIACTQLAKRCAASLPATDPFHLHPFYAKGKPRRQCCGGTFVIEFGDRLEEFPRHDAHQDFISTHALTALCR